MNAQTITATDFISVYAYITDGVLSKIQLINDENGSEIARIYPEVTAGADEVEIIDAAIAAHGLTLTDDAAGTFSDQDGTGIVYSAARVEEDAAEAKATTYTVLAYSRRPEFFGNDDEFEEYQDYDRATAFEVFSIDLIEDTESGDGWSSARTLKVQEQEGQDWAQAIDAVLAPLGLTLSDVAAGTQSAGGLSEDGYEVASDALVLTAVAA